MTPQLVDSFGRTMNYLRVSISDRCNLRCRYCMPEHGVPVSDHHDILSFEEIEQVVRVSAAMGISKVRLTGGEPLLRRGVVSLVEKLAAIPGIKDLSLTTNGLLLAPMVADLKNAGLRRVNISLDSLDPVKFEHLTRGGKLAAALEAIQAAREHGLTPIKLNVVLVRGINLTDIVDLCQLTRMQDLDVRFIELMPIGEMAEWSNQHYVSGAIVRTLVPELQPEVNQEPTSAAVYYRLPGALGRVGLINPISCRFCDHCNRLRLTADGKLKCCLHSDSETDLRAILRSGQPLEAAIRATVAHKPWTHNLDHGAYAQRNMALVGG